MKPKKTILEESIDRISGFKLDEFKIWLKSFLITKVSAPLPGYSPEEYPYEYLYKINESTTNVRFQERLRCAVIELFKDWNVNARDTETIEYYSSLVNLIAELPVSKLYPDLIEIALTGFYCGVLSDNQKLDVQTLILQVIAGFPPSGMKKLKKRLMDLVEKYILDKRYTPLCFRIAWQARYENAIQYIKLLFECYYERKFDIYGTIERFLLGCQVRKFKNLLIPILQELQLHDMRQFFIEILRKVGVEIRVSYFRFEYRSLIVIWEPYDQPQSHVKIFCKDREIMNYIDELFPIDFGDQKSRDKKFKKLIESILSPDPQLSII